MIRLRIDRSNEGGLTDQFEGMVWFEGKGKDRRMSRVIIEELPDAIRADLSYNGISNPFEDEPEWVPVEVIDEQT